MLSRKVLTFIIITLEVISSQKDSDEGRPYEFGFTIDGQQHRHEKKDQNGIIQGEFGFITADGVYHVTVYATDENGDFKILSMKNIRISAPLDGSPALGPISPEASKYLKKANLTDRTEPVKPNTATSAPQKFERAQEASPRTVTEKTIASTQKAPYVFTTLSTIRPACGGCGLIATMKPGLKFDFQNPAFRGTTSEVTSPQVSPMFKKVLNGNMFSSPGEKSTSFFVNGQQQNLPSNAESLSQRLNGNMAPSFGEKRTQPSFSLNGQQQNKNTAKQSSFEQNGYRRQNFGGTAEQQAKTVSTSNDFTSSDNVFGGNDGNVPISRVPDSDYNIPGIKATGNYQQTQFGNNAPGLNKFSDYASDGFGNVEGQKMQTQNRYSDFPSDADALSPGSSGGMAPSFGGKGTQASFSLNSQQQNTNTRIQTSVVISHSQQNTENEQRQYFGSTAEQQAKNVPTSNVFTSSDKMFGSIGGNVPVSRVSGSDYNSPGIQTTGKYQQSQFSDNLQASDGYRNLPEDGSSYGETGQNRNSGYGSGSNSNQAAGRMNAGFSQDKFGDFSSKPTSSNGPNPLLQSQEIQKLPPVVVSDNVIHVMGKKPFDIPIKDKYPGMMDGLPEGVEVKDVTNILYKFKYTVGFHGHYEKGLKDGSKIGGYFVNGRDGISRVVTYVADENGYRPKFKFINLGLDSPDTPNEKTEKTFGLKDFEFVWYPVE
ncbi:uncharacterized protein LOC130891118 [Diorhabda carinulata]|uniref:uncharacterized protein LOC130891118 n=1 Tax=Diorhabda carinulata TaxID=1163345 RepID=UPI0025A17135|nr:uncharacterized protein LOC130891118 [Diorhabda carinulata]